MFGSPKAGSWWTRPYPEIVEIASSAGSVMVLPVGSVEQHGNHLPVGTDTMLVESITDTAIDHLDDLPILTTPPVWSGYSPHHLSYGGTLSLEFQTLRQVIEQVASTGLKNGFDAVLLLNGHGGNVPLINGATSTIGAEYPESEVLGTTYFRLADPFIDEIRESQLGGMGHGGEFETSLMMHYHPGLVHEERLEGDLMDEPYEDGVDDMFAEGSLAVYRGFEAYSDSGAIGDPTLATAEKGRKLANGLGEKLAAILRSIHERNRK